MMLSGEEQAACLKLARETLQQSFRAEVPSLPAGMLEQKLPCFVSLHTKSGRLRGCIGCTSTDVSLAANVQRMTLAAASEDPRFRPLAPDEAGDVHLEISVLGPLVPFTDLLTIEIGKHGLKVASGRRAGLLLAQVATEQKWNAEEFMEQTCLKAGLDPVRWQVYRRWYFEQQCFGEAR